MTDAIDEAPSWRTWADRLVKLAPWLVPPAAIIILLFRRWDQVAHPALWVEEGSQFLHQYLAKGWLYIFEPVNGYLIVPAKLVQFAALHLSFADLPFWTVIITLAVSGLVALAIATAPVSLSYRLAAALIPFLIPIDPKPMAVGEYTFWFVGLLSVLALFWRSDAQGHWLRGGYAVAGALSSPLAVLITPLLIGRAVITRKLPDIAVALVTLALSGWQAWLVFGQENLSDGSVQVPGFGDIPTLVEKFSGDYFINTGGMVSLAVGGLALAIIAALCVWAYQSERRVTPAALFACFVLSIGASIVRVPLDGVDAAGAGPRYFFYPFTLLAWTMLSLATGPIYKRVALLAVTAAPLLQILSPWYVRTHAPMDWRSAAVACIKGRAPTIPQVDPARPPWSRMTGTVVLSGQFQADGVNPGVGFAKVDDAAGSGLAGDAAVGSAQFDAGGPSREWLAVQILTGPDATGQRLDVLGDAPVSVDLAPLTSQLKSGWAYVLVPTSAPVTGVKLTDDGGGWGQWSAIGEVLTGDDPPGGKATVYPLPVHFDGRLESRWKVDLTHADCERLSRGALLDLPLRTVIR